MRAKFCFLCDVPITPANDSREHIISNAVGGRRKTRGFICKPCNSKAGEGWDAALAKQLNILCLFFGITRERGASPMQQVETVLGQKLLMQPGGELKLAAPTIIRTKNEAGLAIQVAARSMPEAREVLEGLKRKHPEIDVERTLKTATSSLAEPNAPVKFSLGFGGEMSGRSIVKTAAAFAHACGLDSRTFNAAKAYLTDKTAEPCFGYYHERDLVRGRPHAVPLHCVAISGDPASGLLLGYVEFFGFQRVVVCLSDHYKGLPLCRAYGIDPLAGKEVQVTVDLHFTHADLHDIYDYGRLPNDRMIDALRSIMPVALKRQADEEQKRALEDAINYAFANCGAKMGDILTEEHARKLSWLVAEKMTPFIQRRISRRRLA